MRTCWIIALGALGLITGCGRNGPEPDGSGTVECTQVDVSPQVAGRILELTPEEGDSVQKGQVVARLDPADYQLKRAETAAALAQARAQFDLLQAGSRKEDIRAAEAQVSEARAVVVAATADLARIRQVHASGSATPMQLDEAQARSDRAQASLAAAEQQALKLRTGSRPEEIQAAKAAVELAEARLAQVQKVLTDCTVLAPMNGVVTTRVREPGEWTQIGSPLLTLSRMDEVWLSIYVPESRLAGVKLGQPARVRVDGKDMFFTGKISFISPEAEFTPKNVQTPEERAKLVYRLKITLPNPEGVFKPGMPADGYLAPGS